MRPTRPVSSKNAPQAHQPAEAPIRHRRADRPSAQLIGRRRAEHPSRSGHREAIAGGVFFRASGRGAFALRAPARPRRSLGERRRAPTCFGDRRCAGGSGDYRSDRHRFVSLVGVVSRFMNRSTSSSVRGTDDEEPLESVGREQERVLDAHADVLVLLHDRPHLLDECRVLRRSAAAPRARLRGCRCPARSRTPSRLERALRTPTSWTSMPIQCRRRASTRS